MIHRLSIILGLLSLLSFTKYPAKVKNSLTSLSKSTKTENKAFFHDLKTKEVASDTSLVWSSFGPGMSGNNKSAFWHPTDPNILYISPNMGNSYISRDKGITYETILDEDGSGIRVGDRGPQDITSIDFSRQSPDNGFGTDEKNNGIFITADRGKSWIKQQSSLETFSKAYLACVAVNPMNDNIWYAGAGRMRDLGRILFSREKPHGALVDANSQGKIWRSDDKGKSWHLINKGLNPKAEVETIIVDPVVPTTVYASTNYGFYKSVDGGQKWELKVKGLDNDVIRSMALQQDKNTNKVTLYIVSNRMWKVDNKTLTDSIGGVYKSLDKGESWINVNSNLAMDMRQFKNNREIKKSYYGVMAYYLGMNANQVQKLYPELPEQISPSFNQVTVDPNDANNVYLINMYSNASRINFKPGSMWRSKDGGNTWFVAFRDGKNWNQGDDIKYWTARGNPLGTNVSIRYLHNWVNRDDYDRKACNFTTFNADGSVLHTQLAKISLMSYDKGETWVDIDDTETSPGSESYIGAGNSNVPGHGFYQSMQVPNKVFCAAGENSLWITNNQTSKEWPNAQAITSCSLLDEESSLSSYAIDPIDTNVHYALFFRQSSRGQFLKSVDDGKSWSKQGTAISKWEITAHNGDQPVHQLCLLINPQNRENIFFCVPKSTRDMEYVGNSVTGFGIHKSVDGGITWSEPNQGLPKSLDVARIVFDPRNANILYAAVQNKNGGLFKSVDNGEHWTIVSSTARIAGEFGINDIHFAIDGKVYITSGYKNAGAEDGGLWVSDDQLKTWKRVFDFPWVNRVEVARYNPKIILISTLANSAIDFKNPGTYLSKDGGESWIKFNKGNGQSDRINDIAIDYFVPGKYYVSTYGSGFYVAKEKN